jgi:hypothetical protein
MGRGYNYATCMEGALVSTCPSCDNDWRISVKVK